MNVHFVHNKKFIKGFVEFTNKNFQQNEQLFIVLRGDEKYQQPHGDNVISLNDKNIITSYTVLKNIYSAKKIFLHGLFIPQLIILLCLHPWLLKKCYWLLWGGDLYFYVKPKTTLKLKIYEKLRANVIRKVGNIVTFIKGDYELAKRWYATQATFCESIVYPSNIFSPIDNKENKKTDDKLEIMLGNSADPSNNHLEILIKLNQLEGDKFRITCPLSYGDKAYKDKVEITGKKLFNGKFKALTDFLSLDDYVEILRNVDVAIFNHNRQQAMGNIITLLGLGKKVYIRDDISSWEFFTEAEIKIFSTNKLDMETLLQPLEEEDRSKNICIVKTFFSQAVLKEQWDKLYNMGG